MNESIHTRRCHGSAETTRSRNASCRRWRATLDAVPSDWDLLLRVALAFALTFAIGFEREIRGGQAGDRTYSLVGMAAAAISAIAVSNGGANAIAGVVTGVGFIGGALVFRGEEGVLRGITSASAVLATAAVGVVAGAGYPILAVGVTGGVLLSLEVRYLPVLRYFDARRYVGSVRSDAEPPGKLRGRRSQGGPSD